MEAIYEPSTETKGIFLHARGWLAGSVSAKCIVIKVIGSSVKNYATKSLQYVYLIGLTNKGCQRCKGAWSKGPFGFPILTRKWSQTGA